MFEFMKRIDATWFDLEQNMELQIRHKDDMWYCGLHTLIEWMLKDFNTKQGLIENSRNITIGTFLSNKQFQMVFTEKTGFGDFNRLRLLNEKRNEAKHHKRITKYSNDEIVEWIKYLHTMVKKTYSFLKKDEIVELFDRTEVEKLFHEEEELISYADMLLDKKDEIIDNLKNETEDLKKAIRAITQWKDEEVTYNQNLIKRVDSLNKEIEKTEVHNRLVLRSMDKELNTEKANNDRLKEDLYMIIKGLGCIQLKNKEKERVLRDYLEKIRANSDISLFTKIPVEKGLIELIREVCPEFEINEIQTDNDEWFDFDEEPDWDELAERETNELSVAEAWELFKGEDEFKFDD